MSKYIASVKVVGVDDTEDGAIAELMYQLEELSRRLCMSEKLSEIDIKEIDEITEL